MPKSAKVKCQIRRDTAENWSLNNPVLLDGEIGIETDAFGLKVGDGEKAWNELSYFYKWNNLSNAYAQKTKLDCSAGTKFTFPTPTSPAFLHAPVEVLKFTSTEESGLSISACSYDNSDSGSFIYDDKCVEFDGVMKLKSAEKDLIFSNLSTFNEGYICSCDVNLSQFQKLLDYSPPTFTKIADTWGNALDSETHNWEQYSEKNDVVKTSLYVKNNVVYGIVEDSFTILSDSWNTLSDTDKWNLFNSTTGEPTANDLRLLEQFTIYSYSLENTVPSYKLEYLPLSQLILPNGLISLSGFELSQVSITYSVTGNSSIKLAVTSDMETFYTFNFVSNEFVEISDISSSEILSNGINVSRLSEIPSSAWSDFSAIGFAYVLAQNDDSENCYTDELVLTVNATGSWKKAVHGTDYDYEYNNDSTATFSVLTAGSYKVNYMS